VLIIVGCRVGGSVNLEGNPEWFIPGGLAAATAATAVPAGAGAAAGGGGATAGLTAAAMNAAAILFCNPQTIHQLLQRCVCERNVD